jgi:hypothetical protein
MWWCSLISPLSSAVERSWGAKFVGMRPLEALEKHVENQMMMGKRYTCYCSIIQSSGMGKSRLLDEFSKKHFLVPINLRPKDSGGVLCLSFHLHAIKHVC